MFRHSTLDEREEELSRVVYYVFVHLFYLNLRKFLHVYLIVYAVFAFDTLRKESLNSDGQQSKFKQ
jgi:hypothetical protein